MSTLWSGRFDSEPDREVFEYGKSLAVDRRLVDDDITGSQAWAEALGRAGVLAPPDVSAIVRGLEAIRIAVRADPRDHRARGRRRRPQLRRARADRTDRRRGPPPAHRAARATNRCPSISACTCAGGFPRSNARSRSLVEALAHQAASAGEAVMPSYTHLRRAQPVLVAHVWLSHAAAIRRDVDRFDAARARSGRDAARLGRDRRHRLRHRRHVPRRPPRLLASVAQQHRHVRRPRFRRHVPLRVLDGDGAPQPARRRRDSVFERGVRLSRDRRLGRDRIEPDAAEEESRSARAGARQVRQGRRPAHRLADDDEGPAAWLQQGSAGRQGGRVRGRGPDDRVRAHDGDGHPHADAAAGSHPRRRVGPAARHRSRRLPRGARAAVPDRARSHRPHRPRSVRARRRTSARWRSRTGARITSSSTTASSASSRRKPPWPRRKPPSPPIRPRSPRCSPRRARGLPPGRSYRDICDRLRSAPLA